MFEWPHQEETEAVNSFFPDRVVPRALFVGVYYCGSHVSEFALDGVMAV